MTLNSLEVTKCCKNYFILFSFFSLQIFIIFYFFIFRIVFGQTCYGTTVLFRIVVHHQRPNGVKLFEVTLALITIKPMKIEHPS
jgi:hypothetical protein